MIKKRLFSALLVLALCLTLLPAQVFAHLGGLPLGNSEEATVSQTTVDGSQVYSLTMKDGHLKFSLAVGGEHAGKSVTASVRSEMSFASSVANGVYEQARFTLQTSGTTQKALTIEKMEVVTDFTDMPVAEFDNALTVRYTFSGYGRLDPHIECYVTYYFVRLGNGATDGVVSDDASDPTSSHTYALVARATWQTTEDTDNTSQYAFRYFQDYHGFSRMGHGSLTESAAHVKLSRTYEKADSEHSNDLTAKATDITTGLGRTSLKSRAYGQGAISEVYSDSYGVDSPFVLTDYALFDEANQDVQLPTYVSYDAAEDCLTAEGNTKISQDPVDGDYRDSMKTLHIWGFRDVYTKTEAADSSEVKFTKPDAVTIPQDADKLGFYQYGDSLVVAAITDAAQEKVLKKRYGEPLYTLRGKFEKKSDSNNNTYYEFTDEKVALTSTITATWDEDGFTNETQHFHVCVSGDGLFDRFDVTSMVQYSTPTFKLYSRDAVGTSAGLSFADNVLTLTMDPEHNEVFVFIDLPEVECKITTAQFQSNGDLVLSGKMGLDFLLNCGENALFTLDKIGYGAETKTNTDNTTTTSFVQKGIAASGGINTGSLIGLDLANIKAKINTFGGEESYAFSLELNAFDLFETEAELELKRLNNGRLVPNDLYFFLAAQPGIPIAPPVPTSYLRGGGGGFYGLADTINGDYIAIPPMRLKLTAAGDYVKVVKGRVNVTLGPSYLEYAGTNLEFADADVLDEFKMYLRLVGEKRSYLGTDYTGVRAGGGLGIIIKAPEGDRAIFEVESSVEASMFGALDDYENPKSAYIQLDSRGSVEASVKIPKKLGDLEFKIIGGKTLANATAEFILGGQTKIPVSSGTTLSEATKQAWENLSIYGGLAHTGSLVSMNWRVYYVIPDHVGGAFSLVRKINDGWSLEEEIDKNAWNVSGKNSADTQSLDWSTDEIYAVCDENGDQVGIAVLENSLYELPVETDTADDGIALLAAPANSKTTKTVTISQDEVGSGALLLKLFPETGSTVDELLENLTITPYNGTQLSLKKNPQYDSEGNITDIADINCIEIEENGKSGLLIATGGRAETTSSITIKANCDFEVVCMASADPTTLKLALSDNTATSTATSTIQNARTGKEYAVRYYLDTKANRSGENYFLDMNELSGNRTDDTFQIPTEGTLAPSGNYYVTAVLVEKVTGDFNGDGTVGKDEWSWITVDTKTSSGTISYTNNSTPAAPTKVTLDATGNETLTATWTPATNADGYRVSLYYQDDNDEWQQAGASYELAATDFGSKTQPSATVDEQNKTLSLRMAPTVSGNGVTVDVGKDGTNAKVSKSGSDSDEAPTNTNYRVEVEAYKDETTPEGALSSRYYSAAALSDATNLPAYTPIALEVKYGDEDQYSITLNGTNGYDTLTWSTLPTSGFLFTATAEKDGVTIAAKVEQGSGNLRVDECGNVSADTPEVAQALIKNGGRIKLTVTEGKDKTDYYLRLVLDDVAPVLTLDSGSVAADPTTGKYTVTGTTEPGLTVSLADSNATPVKADAEGRFELTGTLTKNSDPAMNETEGFVSLLSEVSTQDAAGNAADPAAVIITARAQEPDTPVTPPTSGGGSSSPSYAVSAEEIRHGSVTVSPKSAKKGSTVTVTVTPDKGYTLETLTVTDASGKELPLTDNGDGKYTFTMPSSKVTVKATFMEDNTMLNFFVDVKAGDYYYDAVLWAAQNGITSGISATEFGPNQPCIRAQIVTFLWRAAGSPEPKNVSSFTDVPANSYYAKAVAWAVENGITVGTGAETFSPNESCTRAQAVTFLARALNAKASGKAAFSDVPSGSYYADAVAWAAESGVTTGTSADAFSPDDVCTRGQIVTFLWRAYSK